MTTDEALAELSRGICSRHRVAESGCEQCGSRHRALDVVRELAARAALADRLLADLAKHGVELLDDPVIGAYWSPAPIIDGHQQCVANTLDEALGARLAMREAVPLVHGRITSHQSIRVTSDQKYESAFRRRCPKCDAAPRRLCIGKDGSRRQGFHEERFP